MIQFVEHKDIDKKKWDDCIDQSLNQSVSAYSWYLDKVFAKWSAIILGDYEAVFPLPIKSKFSISYFLQPLFIRCIGIYAKVALTEELVNSFFDAIPTKIKLIDFYLQENIPFNRDDYTSDKRIVQILDIKKPYEEIQQGYAKSATKNLRKAVKNELSVVSGLSPKMVATMYKENISAQVDRLDDNHFKEIESVMKSSLDNDCGFSIGVHNKQKELIATAFFMKTKNTVYFSFGSANAEGKKVGAMYFMVDEVIRKCCKQYEKLDFEGSDIEGIANFNRNFGAKDCVYLQVKKNDLPSIVKWISRKK